MGQLLSWIRGPRDGQAVQDVSVEEQSQPSRATPKPAAQVSAVKPAEFEKASSGITMAAKSSVVSTTTSGAGESGVKVGASSTIGAGGKQAAKAKAETSADSHAKVKAPAPTPRAGTAAAATASTAAPVSAATKAKETLKETAKVHVEVASSGAPVTKQTPAEDPFDALAGSLPSSDPVAPPQPSFTGPKVKEHDITVEKAQKCGENDNTLPPEYRLKKETPGPANVQPKEEPINFSLPGVEGCGTAPTGVVSRTDLKPLSTDDALESLSAGFTESCAPPAVHKEKEVSAAAVRPVAMSPAPPADKKAKIEKVSDDLSLSAGLPSPPTKAPPAPATAVSSAPPADKKPKLEEAPKKVAKPAPASAPFVKAEQVAKAKPKAATEKDASMSLDALSALGGTLATEQPKPEPPKPSPKDLVSEKEAKPKKGDREGEEESSIPPEYRFKEEDLMKLPATEPEPTMDTSDALDILSGDFMTSSTVPTVQAPVVSPPAALAQKPPAPPTDKKKTVEKGSAEFSLEAGLSASAAKKVESPAPPPTVKEPAPSDSSKLPKSKKMDEAKPKAEKSKGDSITFDALSALGDTLPTDAPKPESPKLKPKDIVTEKVKSKKGVLVGEREDSLPPDYRFKEEDLKKLPAPEPEPTMETGEALDFLSGGFTTSSAAPAVHSSAPPHKQPPTETKVEDLSALDVLSSDFAASSKVSTVQAPAPKKKIPEKTVCPMEQHPKPEVLALPQETKPKSVKSEHLPLDALSALGDTLPAAELKPESPKLKPEELVPEGRVETEEGVTVGDRDDTLPPDYRFDKEELTKLPAPEPEPSMGTGEALDILSEGFLSCSTAPATQASVIIPSAPPAQALDSALDALAGDFASSSSAALALKSESHISVESGLELPGVGADSALDALSDSLKDIAPTPQPAPVPTKDIVQEKKIVEERLIKMGERDDSLPPEYRPTEEELKKLKESKESAPATPTQDAMDDKTALDLLSGDLSAAAECPAPTVCPTEKLELPVLDSEPLKPMAGAALDSLASSLVSEALQAKSKIEQPKTHTEAELPATDLLSAQLSTDVVATKSAKGGKS